jgi:hypothetical protein
MVKGSEPYYRYTIDYSFDGSDYITLDRTDNILYGFTNDSVNFTARYVRITETGYVCQNGCGFYAPSLMEAQLVQAPPSQNLPVNMSVTPSSPVVAWTDAFSVGVTVDGGPDNPTPSGKVTLSGGGYTATFGLVNGSSTFPIAAGAMAAGCNTITVTYTPDPTSAPIYGTTPVTGTASVKVGDVHGLLRGHRHVCGRPELCACLCDHHPDGLAGNRMVTAWLPWLGPV